MVDLGAFLRIYHIRALLCSIMVWMKVKTTMDSLHGQARRMPCFFWFVLLFGIGGLLLFIHQEDLSEMVQLPGLGIRNIPQPSRQNPSPQDQEKKKSDNDQAAEASPISPMQLPNFEKNKQKATPISQEQDIGSLQTTKKQRQLLKTSPNESREKLQSIMDARKQLMKEMCAKYKSSISKTITPEHVKHIYVEDKNKLLYCSVPKSGCSNWKRTLMVLSGQASRVENIPHETVHNGVHIKNLNTFNQKEIMHRLETYNKFLFVREPLERVVSAYRDKFENPNDYYHNMFGKPIISKYRVTPSAEALKTGNGVTFKEFIRYLLDVHRPVGMDVHWEQMNQLCHPCVIHYDVIGKFENMEEESNFLLRMIGAPQNLMMPSFKDRNPGDARTSKEITEKYFSQVTMMERQRVYDFYYMDYLMFNYSKPFSDLY
ncbi:carbohydrate sulfotransferase 8 [Kryptolebias marmoratus]|uniref:Carbohydrate sulfotransferase n=1 Tax=Kryptolebias marmoratus TaxID=37003 RepID=A0A3Q2ZEB6_KRYMA|nr:carbohydrate sulfotransferase 8 [Kryptolebias marmoratus]